MSACLPLLCQHVWSLLSQNTVHGWLLQLWKTYVLATHMYSKGSVGVLTGAVVHESADGPADITEAGGRSSSI